MSSTEISPQTVMETTLQKPQNNHVKTVTKNVIGKRIHLKKNWKLQGIMQ